MTDAFLWLLAIEVIGLIAFPLSFIFFRQLPDRGYAFTKVLGLILIGFFLFIGASIGIVTNSRLGVLVIICIIAVTVIAISLSHRSELVRFLQKHWRYILLVEVMFAVVFVIGAYLRSFVPEISGTEKPTEFAIFNAILRSDHFPAEDPWMAGNNLSYYYLGFIMFGSVTKLLGTSASIAFNLALITTATLATISIFGAVYNMVATQVNMRRGIIFGLIGAVMLMFLSSLEGIFELIAAHDVGPTTIYKWVEVEGLSLANSTTAWYPDESWWWWRATRVPSSWDIEEFPFFSFLLGDLHPHVMAIPFTILAVATIINLAKRQEAIDIGWLRRNWLHFTLLIIIIGGLSFIHSWSFPPVLLLFGVIVFATNWWQKKRNLKVAAKNTASIVTVMVAGSILFYLPFYLTSHGGLWPPAPVEAIARPNSLPLWSMVTPPKHLFLGWGHLLWVGFGVGVALLSRSWLQRLGWRASLAFLPGLLPLGIWALLAIGNLGIDGFWHELSLRGSNLLTLAILISLIGLFTTATLRFVLAEKDKPNRAALTIALSAMTIAILLILGVELFYSLDRGQGVRSNTVFKLYYQAWIFLALAIPVALHYTLPQSLKLPRPKSFFSPASSRSIATIAWGFVAITLLLAGLVYPLTATFARTDSFTGKQSLDGLSFLHNSDRSEFEATMWLIDNVAGSPVILEAVGDPYSSGGRISSRTGLPTIIQWASHQHQWRGSTNDLNERIMDVAEIYISTDITTTIVILERYEVDYVYVGELERHQYGEAGLGKFATFMEVVYENSEVTIYKMPDITAPVTTLPISG